MTKSQIDVDLIRQWFDNIDAREGIGQDLFLAISQMTPSLNVDLIIRSPDDTSTLLTWRDDQYYGPGWHVPGGVIRFKEKMIDRVHKVATAEFDNIAVYPADLLPFAMLTVVGVNVVCNPGLE